MPMYNLIEDSDNYSDTSGRLWQFKRDDVPANNVNLCVDNSLSFKYKEAFVGTTVDAVNNTNTCGKKTQQLLFHLSI